MLLYDHPRKKIETKGNLWGQSTSAESIPRLVESEKLQYLVLCERGIGRSFSAARDLCQAGKPAVCLRGGIGDLDLISSPMHPRKKQLEPLIDKITTAPNIIIFLSEYELAQYQNVIRMISEKMTAKGNRLIIAPDIVSFYKATNVLVDL